MNKINPVIYIRPGRPTKNDLRKTLNSKFPDECLTMHWFASLAEAQEQLNAWCKEYNGARSNSSLGEHAASEYIAGLAASFA